MGVLPDGALGARARWFLDQLAAIGGGGDAAVDVDAVERDFVERPPGLDDDAIRRIWATAARRMGHGRLVDVEEAGAGTARLLLEVGGGRRFWLTFDIEPEAPHRIIRFNTAPAVPAGLTLRAAEQPADGPALAALEREAPIVLPHRSARFDHEGDYFASWSLLTEPGAVVAETEDAGIVASVQICLVPFRVNGRTHRGAYTHRVRTHPRWEGQGLLQHLTQAGLEAKPLGPGGSMDALVVCIAHGNEAMLKTWAGRPGEWPWGPTRVEIDCAAALAATGAEAVPVVAPERAGLEQAVAALNATHELDEGFVPYDEASLAERLGRAPHLYGREHLHALGGAVLGVWEAGRTVRTIVTTAAGEQVQRRAVAADWGFLPGHEDDFAALLRAVCRSLLDAGLTHLCVYASPPTPGWGVLETMPGARETFHLWTLPIPPGPPEHGTYVDAIAF